MFQDADKGYDDELGNLDTFVVYKAETNKQLKQTMFFLKWPVKRTVSQVTTVADLYIYMYIYTRFCERMPASRFKVTF